FVGFYLPKIAGSKLPITLEQYFINEQADFYAYMIDKSLFKSRKTYQDYISRLRYVSHYYRLDKTLTRDDISLIIEGLHKTIKQRDKYNTNKGITDIASGLKRFLDYVQSDYRKKLEDSVLAEESKIQKDSSISETERESIVKSRIGQGYFRNKLIEYWQGCSVTQCRTISLLMASHIQPWRKSDNEQRLDVYNGLLLTPNLDKLFDKGYISFDKKGKIICSNALPKDDLKSLAISHNMQLTKVEEHHQKYLEFHRNNCLI
ncbi:MAG: HNH endonuclease, partial [archaeon]|nr:HNH endonuclease [archaeon]